MSLPNKIYSDVLLKFGKYKGREVADVLLEDTAYFHWLRCAGVATLDNDIAEVVDAWVKIHKEEARKTEWSADKARAKSEKEKAEKAGSTEYRVIPPKVVANFAATVAPSAPLQEAWGTW